MINVLTCNRYWIQLPESAPVPRHGDHIQFPGFTLRVTRVLWEPSEGWSANIECNMIRQNWSGTERDLFEATEFAALPE